MPLPSESPQSPVFLMCPPDHFGVSYDINAWMTGHIGGINHPLAVRQWNDLHAILQDLAKISVMEAQPNLPDLVFTANAGLTRGKQVVVSRFRHKERQGEEPFFYAWFKQKGFNAVPWPKNAIFEGAGDALWDRATGQLWLANGFRSSPAAAALLEAAFGRETISLTLVNPRFYHLDTCLCPLSNGDLMYAPMAFDADSLKKIETLVAADRRIPVAEEDALDFCCNAVEANRHLVMNGASAALRQRLVGRGFTPIVTPLSEFMKAGGGAKCLTLRVDEL